MKKYIVKPGSTVDLKDWDSGDHSSSKEEAQPRLLELNNQLEAMQEMLYAEHKHKVLVILQGMDTSGKDGTVRHVFEGVNPQGVRVASFKVPTPIEMDHDYLWRVHSQVPGKGELVIFNRSHYEDVLVVRIHNLVPAEVWQRRYQQINDFERMLCEEGTTILKFFLFISKDEQRQRLLERLDDPNKHWKFNPGDIDERKLWDQYQAAYQDMLNKTSTEWAPWTIVPADHKWFRDLVISERMVDTLDGLHMQYPQPELDIKQLKSLLEND